MTTNQFDQWAIVEIMGHQRLAGRVTEQAVGGSNFVRVDVPEIDGCPPFTKLLGPASIYAMTITDEETARAAALSFRAKPLDEYSARKMIEQMELRKQLPSPPAESDDDGYDDDGYPL